MRSPAHLAGGFALWRRDVANTGVRCAGCNPREWSLRPHGPTTCPRRAAAV